MMKKYIEIAVMATVVCCLLSCHSVSEETRETGTDLGHTKYGVELDKYYSQSGVIGNGDFFGPLLIKLGASNEQVQALIKAAGSNFDVRKMKVGNEYEALYDKKIVEDNAIIATIKIEKKEDRIHTEKGKLSYFIYNRDPYTHVVFSLKDSVYVKIIEDEIQSSLKFSEVKINSSLWQDLKDAGVSPLLALKLSDIYAWTIDFFGLQKGDSFKVLYEELAYEDDVIDIDDIYYVEFNHKNKPYYAIRFSDGNNENKYWNELGESLKKAFLKAPLNFFRITSKFTYARKHPVLKIVRPHTGVDYAAPKGTPVMAIGSGTVIYKGWSGGGGNTIKIKHNSTYTTSYMHLSGYSKSLRKGGRVTQGEIIGYVGSTGLSTGPHLDFRVYKNNKPIDPLKMESPSALPVSKANMEAFKSTVESYRATMDSLKTQEYVDKLIKGLSPAKETVAVSEKKNAAK